MLMLRNTPRNEVLKSPAQRLFSRCTRTTLPISIENLKPKVVTGVTEELTELRINQKRYADRVAVPRPPLQVGDEVRMKTNHREWTKAKVVQETEYPRSVVVETTEGRKFRRNTFHLNKTPQSKKSIQEKHTEIIPPTTTNPSATVNANPNIPTNNPLPTSTNIPTNERNNKPKRTRYGSEAC